MSIVRVSWEDMPVNVRYFLKRRRAIGLPGGQPVRGVNPANRPGDFADCTGKRGRRVFVKIIDLFEVVFGNYEDMPFVALV